MSHAGGHEAAWLLLATAVCAAAAVGCGGGASCDAACSNATSKCGGNQKDTYQNACLEQCTTRVAATTNTCAAQRDALLSCIAGASSVKCDDPQQSFDCQAQNQALDQCKTANPATTAPHCATDARAAYACTCDQASVDLNHTYAGLPPNVVTTDCRASRVSRPMSCCYDQSSPQMGSTTTNCDCQTYGCFDGWQMNNDPNKTCQCTWVGIGPNDQVPPDYPAIAQCAPPPGGLCCLDDNGYSCYCTNAGGCVSTAHSVPSCPGTPAAALDCSGNGGKGPARSCDGLVFAAP
jgi:hypothetical protein